MVAILITAYAVNPYQGSESGMGWALVLQAARFNKIKVVTRENNKDIIEKYIRDKKVDDSNLEFYYFDLPYLLRFWKKGQRGSSLYFYLWQMFMPIFVRKTKIDFDIAHNLNFHADAFPSFLWLFNKPFIWGPIVHHEKINSKYIIKQYGLKAFIKDRLIWCIKIFLWTFDPFLKIAKAKAVKILGGNSSVKNRLRLDNKKFILFTSVGTENVELEKREVGKVFHILTIGRFVPLKGFDVAISSFVKFLNDNPGVSDILLTVIGQGPEENHLMRLVGKLEDKTKIQFVNWVNRDQLAAYYRNASLLLFPSHEGAGMVVAEALSHGLPVVCFDNFGPGELVDESCSLRVPYTSYDQSISDFSNALEKFYDDKEFHKQKSIGARRLFEKKYAWDQKGLILKDIYDSVLAVK